MDSDSAELYNEHGESDASFNDIEESRYESESEDIFVNPNDFECCDDELGENNFKQFLADWAIKYCVPRTHLNSLLKGIKKRVEIPFDIDLDLPKDYRSLLKTPREMQKYISEAAGGKFAYFGIRTGLQRLVTEGFF